MPLFLYNQDMQEEKEIRISNLIIKKFWPLFNDFEHVHQIITSGRAGTKSSFGAIMAVFEIIQDRPQSVAVLRKFHNKLRKTVFNECVRAIDRLGIPQKYFRITKAPMQIEYLINGNKIIFSGSDSIDDTKGLIDEGRPITLVLLDELTEFFDSGDGEDEINNITATFIRGNSDRFRMLYLYNPPKNPYNPVHLWTRHMEQRPDAIHVHSDYRDVPVEWLGEKLIQEAEMMRMTDEKMYRWIWKGEAVGLDDVIYYMMTDKHIRSRKGFKSDFYIIGVDYGQMNATTYQAFGVSTVRKEMQGLQEYYYSGRDEGKQKSPSVYAQDMKKFIEDLESKFGKKAVTILIDPSAKGLKEEIKRVCPAARIKSAVNDVALGISRVQKLISYNRFYVSPAQVNLIGEMHVYSYDPKSIERGKEEPLKLNDHCCDATRYATMEAWKWLKEGITE